MTSNRESLLTEVEKALKEKYNKDEASRARVPSDARPTAPSERVTQILLDVEDRPDMPFTKEKYIVRENPHLITWERETRRFLRKLPLHSGHRISATMVYEWATGIKVRELVAEGGNANSDLRKINEVLRFYFGKSFKTWIMGRQVPNAYRVPQGWRVKYHRPMTMTLLLEYHQKTLDP